MLNNNITHKTHINTQDGAQHGHENVLNNTTARTLLTTSQMPARSASQAEKRQTSGWLAKSGVKICTSREM